jgi:hypothetical protein
MSDWKCLRFFYDAFENGMESLDARYKGCCQEISFDFGSSPSSKMKEHRFSLPFTSFGDWNKKMEGERAEHWNKIPVLET